MKKFITPVPLAGLALALGVLFSAGPAWAEEKSQPTNEEDPAAMALTEKILAVELPEVDAQAAVTLARNNGCFRCHGIEKEEWKAAIPVAEISAKPVGEGAKEVLGAKVGPSWSSVAERFRPLPAVIQPIVQKRLIYHLVSGERANFPDGHSEFHRFLHTDPPGDAAQIKNLVVWLLSL